MTDTAIQEQLDLISGQLERLLAKDANGAPDYATGPELERITGLSRDVIKAHGDMLRDPLPYLQVGNRRYYDVQAARKHFERYQIRGIA